MDPPDTPERPPEPADEEPEFEDEPPGAVLFEHPPRPALVVWGAANFLLVAGLGTAALALGGQGGAARLPLNILWVCLPVSAILGLLITAFTRLNLPAGADPDPIARWAFGLHLLTLGAWVLLSWGAGATF